MKACGTDSVVIAAARGWLGSKDAVLTIHDMRSLLECIQFVRRTAVQTAVNVITTGVLGALLAGIAMKPRWFGHSP
jgi:hypothetical protein